MKTDYTIISRFRNKSQCEALIEKIQKKGKTCYNFCAIPADPNNASAHPEEQMKAFESVKDFFNNEYFQYTFKEDLKGLKNADKVILFLPAGTSAHIEIGIAFGLGKPLILIGEPEKPESLYLIFKERYRNADEFLKSI
jgi:nucleoside 2-deoxyribosyltransferase